jgi:hypothetical protein
MSQPSDPNYRSYDFHVIQEDWNEYELQDGTRVKGKLVVTKILRRQTTPLNQFEITGVPVFVVTTDPSRRRVPTPLTSEEVQVLNTPGPNDIKVPVETATSAERWNQYRITQTDEVLRVKLILIDMFRVRDRYDEMGEPMYWFTSGQIVAPLAQRSDNNRLTP